MYAYKYTYFRKDRKRYIASLKVCGVSIHIGTRKTAKGAQSLLDNVFIFPKQVVIYKGKQITVIKRNK